MAKRSNMALKTEPDFAPTPNIGCCVSLEIKAKTVLTAERPMSKFTKFFIPTSFSLYYNSISGPVKLF